MAELEDKFWDAAITEAATKRRPPDQADQILMRLQIPDLGPPKSEPKARVFKLRRVLEVGAAAAALIAIGILTGLIPLGGDGPDNGIGPDPEPRMIAAAPGTEFETHEHHVELKDGWLLVTTGAPDVHCEGSTLTNVDGRVLVHAGSMPTGAQAKSVADWLKANELEQEMINQVKRWVQGAGLAALVLSGSAMLDGNRIEAQEEKPPAEPVWHEVSSVMAIEQLPKDAIHVRGKNLKGPHLEFLSVHTQIRSLDVRGVVDMRQDHLAALVKLTSMKVLDLRDSVWTDSVGYGSLVGINSLEELRIDFPVGMDDDLDHALYSPLNSLSGRGVRIKINRAYIATSEQIQSLLGRATTIYSLDLAGNRNLTDADFKVIAEYAALRDLNVFRMPNLSELGLAYLAKANRLESLVLDVNMGPAVGYQLSKMTNLVSLDYRLPPLPQHSRASIAPLGAVLAECLPNMTGLKHLSLPIHALAEADWAKGLSLETLQIVGDEEWFGDALQRLTDAQRIHVLGQAVACARHVSIEIRVEPLVRDAKTGTVGIDGKVYGATDADDFTSAVGEMKDSDRVHSLELKLVGLRDSFFDGRPLRGWKPESFASLPGLDAFLDHLKGLKTLRVSWASGTSKSVTDALEGTLQTLAKKHELELDVAR